MATVALRRRTGAVRARWIAGARTLEAGGLLALTALSLAMRTTRMGTHFWIDEGVSVGIASHPLTHIPGLLLQDGSPPLYYLLLHWWMGAFGTSEVATHWLSLVFALLCVPAGYWVGRSLFGRATGWILAGLAALCPFLTSYAQETRMYSLVALLGLLTVGCFLHAYVYGRRRYAIGFGVGLAALLYTHNWALFLTVALLVAFAVIWRAAPAGERGALVRWGLAGFGLAAVLYAPWLPSLMFQMRHTGAPWAGPPGVATLLRSPDQLLGGHAGTFVVLVCAGAGVVTVARSNRRDARVLVPVLLLAALLPILLAWATSQVSPSWATRYLAITVGPLLTLAALGLRRAGRLGIAGIVLLVLSWAFTGAPSAKSNAHYIAATMAPLLHRGDMVISTQPEQVPVLHYYLRPGLRYASPFGIVHDTGVVDWRDGAQHFDRTSVDGQLLPLLRAAPVGSDVLLVVPIIYEDDRWEAPWTSRVRDRSIEYEGVLRGDPRFRLVSTVPGPITGSPGPNPLQAMLFEKVRGG